MAFIRSILGPVTGKVGELVMSDTKDGNVVRVYQPKVSNPRTVNQILRRAQLKPAQLFYGKLVEILDHSFAQSALLSYRDFMSAALKGGTYPYMPKTNNEAWPGVYDMTKGSLASISRELLEGAMYTYFFVPASVTTITGRVLIENNSDLIKDGDQLTIIACGRDANDNMRWASTRINVANDDRPINALLHNGGEVYVSVTDLEGVFSQMEAVEGACVIRTTMIGDSYVYSKENFHVSSTDWYTSYRSSRLYDWMLQSYGATSISNQYRGGQKYLQQLVGVQPNDGVLPPPEVVNAVEVVLKNGASVNVYSIARTDGNYVMAKQTTALSTAILVDADGNNIKNGDKDVTYGDISDQSVKAFAGCWYVETYSEP